MSKEIKTAILVLSGILLFIFIFYYLKGENILDNSKKISAIYDNVEGLAPSAAVTINGHKIGKVQSIHFTNDLSGKLNIVIVAFKRNQQEDVNTWIEALGGFVKANSDIELYELPTLKNFNMLMRLNINNGMRYGIASKESREQTITLYLDKGSFKSRLLIPNEKG